MSSRLSIITPLLACGLVAAAAAPAAAQSATTGAIAGRVLDRDSREPAAGVLVTATSPALLEPQSAFTGEDGTYKITELPPGDYTVSFDGDDAAVVRAGIRVQANTVVPVFQMLKRGETIRMFEPAPHINVLSTDRGGKQDREFLEKIPIPTRDAIAAAGVQPGVQNDGVGLAVGGSTGLENRFFVDGIDITGLTYGDAGTPVHNEFVEEIEVLTGGYNAEWGRAIGGIVNIVTRRGSNRLRGSVFGTWSPGFLTAPRVVAPRNASSIDVTADRAYAADFGFELGGPVVRDRLWFYIGLAPQLARTDLTRITKRQTDCRYVLDDGRLSGCDARLTSNGGHADGIPDVDPATGFFITDEVDRTVHAATSVSYSAIGKLNLSVTPAHQVQLTALAVPSRDRSPQLFGLPGAGRRTDGLSFDTALRWTSKLHGGATELEATVAWHHARLDAGALDPLLDRQPLQVLRGGDLGRLAALGFESSRTAQGCSDAGGGADPYPFITNCPMPDGYVISGIGALARDREDRFAGRVAALRRARLAGTHELKLGLDVEDNRKTTARLYSGGALIDNNVSSGQVQVTRWVQIAAPDELDPRFDRTCTTPDHDGGSPDGAASFRCAYVPGTPGAPGTEVLGQTLHWAAFLRDSWQPRPNVTLNAGVRYEEQLMRYARDLRGTIDPLTGNRLGRSALDLRGNLAPRLGAIWDPSEIGASKLFASWGRFFEAIPMNINDRSFGGEVSYRQTFAAQSAAQPCGPTDPRIGSPDGAGCLDPSGPAASQQLFGSSGVLVAPGLRAQYLDELVVGAEYQLARDLKLGLSLQHRTLGRVIEDVSTDGADTYIIANPGEWSAAEERRLLDRIARTGDADARARLEHQLDLFRGIRRFDRPTRDYRAIELALSRRFARGLFVQASYTYARTIGNFPGSVSYDNGQIDPNISSQYDLIELLANRRGPLPQDRPHGFKLDGHYTHALGAAGALTLGTRLRTLSGVPVSALGAHYLYGPDESFLLPRGQMGRTSLQHGVDLHVGYARRLPRGVTVELFCDAFNLYDRQGTFAVDQTYAPPLRRATSSSSGGTLQNVNPISGGGYEDLVWAKVIDQAGVETPAPIARNPNFGRTTTRYAPASARLGFRVTF